MATPDTLTLMTVYKYKLLEAQRVVRWNAVSRTWAARNPEAEWGVIFNSANDMTATAPTDPNIKVGDEWVKHPLAT